MTATDIETPTPPRRTPQVAPRPIGLVVAVVGLVLVAGLFARWWTHATLFQDPVVAYEPAPYALDDFPEYVGLAIGDPGRTGHELVRLERAEVTLAHNTAGATASVAICTRKPQAEGSLSVGVQLEGHQRAGQRIEDLCTEIRPVRPGTTFDYGPDEYLVATFTPAQRGTFQVASVDIEYRRDWMHLWQHGTQHLSGHFTQVVR